MSGTPLVVPVLCLFFCSSGALRSAGGRPAALQQAAGRAGGTCAARAQACTQPPRGSPCPLPSPAHPCTLRPSIPLPVVPPLPLPPACDYTKVLDKAVKGTACVGVRCAGALQKDPKEGCAPGRGAAAGAGGAGRQAAAGGPAAATWWACCRGVWGGLPVPGRASCAGWPLTQRGLPPAHRSCLPAPSRSLSLVMTYPRPFSINLERPGEFSPLDTPTQLVDVQLWSEWGSNAWRALCN